MAETVIISKELKGHVEGALRSFLPEAGKGQFVCLEVVQVIERPFSVVVFFKAHTDRYPYDTVLKKVVHHPMNIALTKSENQAEVEYSMLSSLYPAFKNERYCSVPQPIAVFPAQEAYLMEYVSGSLLSEEIKAVRYLSSKKKFVALKNWYRLCGRWLNRFQDVTANEPSGIDIFSATLRRCREKLDIIQESKDPRCPFDLKERVLEDLDREIKKIGSEKVMSAGRHGDFGVWNIMIHGDGITVFDFLGSRSDSVAVDVLKVLVNLEDEKKSFTSSRWRIEELKKSFLAGYGPLPTIQRSVAVICETLHRVCSLSAKVTNSKRVSGRRRLEEHLCLKDHLRWLNSSSERKVLLWGDYLSTEKSYDRKWCLRES